MGEKQKPQRSKTKDYERAYRAMTTKATGLRAGAAQDWDATLVSKHEHKAETLEAAKESWHLTYADPTRKFGGIFDDLHRERGLYQEYKQEFETPDALVEQQPDIEQELNFEDDDPERRRYDHK